MAWWLVRRTATAALRAQKLTLIGRGLRPLSYVSEEDPKRDWYHGPRPQVDKEIGGRIAKFVEYAVECQKNTGIVSKAITVFFNDDKFDVCSIDTKLKVLSKVFDRIRNYPQADPYEVFLMKIYLRSMCTDDTKNELTREKVRSRVLDVVQSYPKVPHQYKVTEDTYIGHDLGCEDFDFELLQKALYLEFKLYIPESEVKGYCKESIDYIYNNQKERRDFEIFREMHINGDSIHPNFRIKLGQVHFKKFFMFIPTRFVKKYMHLSIETVKLEYSSKQ